MAEFLKLATFSKYGKHNVSDFTEDVSIMLLDFRRDVFNPEYIDTVHIFAITENKIGIQLILKSETFNGDIATYYSTLCDMCKKYCIADIYPFYPMFIRSLYDQEVYSCGLINVSVDKVLTECDEYPTEIRINAEIPDTISKNIFKAISGSIFDSYYYLGIWLKHQCAKNNNLSEYKQKGYMVDV